MDKLIAETEKRMKAVAKKLQNEFLKVRTGRAHPGLLDDISVEYYGSELPIKQLANIGVPEARLITITPWDKNAVEPIEKAILSSDLGLTPSSDGTVIRLQVPQLNEERRKELQKKIRQMAEQARIAVRNIRREANSDLDNMEQEQNLSEDEVKRGKDEIQDITDTVIEHIDEITENKAEEVMQI